MKILRTFYLSLILIPVLGVYGQQLPVMPKKQFHLYLLAGQSNMAGRGKVDSLSKQTHPRVWMLNKANEWVLATDPMHFDKPVAGVGPGLTFGKILAEADTNVYIGLIPCAVGGSSIEAWNPDSIHRQTMAYPWNDAIKRTNIALQKGTLKGILWHQGEADCKANKTPSYGAKLTDLVKRFRKVFRQKRLPFIAGTLSDFWVAWNPDAFVINQIINELPQKMPATAVVSSRGLTGMDDKTHFDTDGARGLGKRYAEAWLNMAKR